MFKSNRGSAGRSALLLTALAATTFTFAACDDDGGPADPGPTPRPVATVTVVPGTVTLQVGDTLTLRAVARDAAGDSLERPVTWTSANPARASVSASGRLTALEPGTVRVTAKAENRAGVADITIEAQPEPQPEPPVITALDPAQVHAGGPARVVRITGAAFRPNARVRFNGATRASEWVSETEVRVTLPADDLAGTGDAEIVVINPDEGQASAPAVFRIVAQPRPVESVSVHPELAYTTVGAAVPLAATVRDASGVPIEGRLVTYQSGNHLVATVDGEGVVRPVGIGRVTITVRSEGVETTAVIEVRSEVHGIVASDGAGLVSFDLRLGRAPQRFWEHGAFVQAHSPTRSPDARRIAYIYESGWSTFLTIMDVANRTYTFVPDAAWAADPAWSPAGDRIAFGALVGGQSHVFTVRPDGTGLVNLTADLPEGVSAGDPAWSPDGTRLVYAIDGVDGQYGLMIMNSDGSGKRYLTVGTADFDPSWVGDVVVFTRLEAGGDETNVWRVSVSGVGPLVRLTDSGRAYSPTMSPDQYWVAFVDGADGEAGALRAVTGFGEEVRTLYEPTDGQPGLVHPVWVVRP